MKIRTLIVDDEPLARQRLRKLLELDPDITVLGECGDGEQAIAEVCESRPDLMFLDVQMPALDGFGVLHALHASNTDRAHPLEGSGVARTNAAPPAASRENCR